MKHAEITVQGAIISPVHMSMTKNYLYIFFDDQKLIQFFSTERMLFNNTLFTCQTIFEEIVICRRYSVILVMLERNIYTYTSNTLC